MDILSIRQQFATSASRYNKTKSSDHNAFGGFISASGSYQEVGRWACHGWLGPAYFGRWGYSKQKPVKYVLSAVMHRHANVTKQQHLDFIDWQVNRSVWANLFVDKDANRILDLGHVVDADNCPDFIASAMIASRLMTESYSGDEICKRVDVYHELLDAGCSNEEAFFFCHMYNHTGKNTYPVVFSRWQSGHSTFFGNSYNEDYVRNFLRGNPVNKSKELLSEGKGYTRVNGLWGNQSTRSDAFGEAVKGIIPEQKHKKEDLHIFRKAPKEGFEYTNREDFMSVINQLRRIINA